jgi:hypothetical protein
MCVSKSYQNKKIANKRPCLVGPIKEAQYWFINTAFITCTPIRADLKPSSNITVERLMICEVMKGYSAGVDIYTGYKVSELTQ